VAPDQRDPTKEEIAEAWVKRPGVVGSFQYRVEVTELDAIPKKAKATNDPFGQASEKKSGRYATVQKALVMRMDGEKVWASEKGDHFDMDNGQVIDQWLYLSFDGSTYRRLVGSSRIALHLATFGGKGMPSHLWTITGSFHPILVWANPMKELSWIGPHFENAQMTAIDRNISGAGGLQLEVVGKHKLRYSVLVSRSYPFLPVQLVYRDLQHRLWRRLECRYETDATGYSRLAGWTDAIFDKDGGVTKQSDGKVTEFVHGKPFADQDFALSFPVGTTPR
jgi:hypothetical protein